MHNECDSLRNLQNSAYAFYPHWIADGDQENAQQDKLDGHVKMNVRPGENAARPIVAA
jgi:hypothetical protein